MQSLKTLVLFLAFASLTCAQSLGENEIPVCTSRFDHDFKVLQKLSDLEFELKHLKKQVSQLESTGSHTHTSSCLDGWTAWEGKCYYFLTEKRNYTAAQMFCEKHGGKLAEPLTCTANDFLKDMARTFHTENWWIGLTDEEEEGHWVWRSSGLVPTYTDWRRGNPNQGRLCNCGGYWYRYDYGWVDEPCEYSYNAICEI